MFSWLRKDPCKIWKYYKTSAFIIPVFKKKVFKDLCQYYVVCIKGHCAIFYRRPFYCTKYKKNRGPFCNMKTSLFFKYKTRWLLLRGHLWIQTEVYEEMIFSIFNAFRNFFSNNLLKHNYVSVIPPFQGSASECVLVMLLAARHKAMKDLKKQLPYIEDGVLLSKLVAYSSKLVRFLQAILELNECVEKPE